MTFNSQLLALDTSQKKTRPGKVAIAKCSTEFEIELVVILM
jgi:hypothetical protein